MLGKHNTRGDSCEKVQDVNEEHDPVIDPRTEIPAPIAEYKAKAEEVQVEVPYELSRQRRIKGAVEVVVVG